MFKKEAANVMNINQERLQKLSFFRENIREEAGKYMSEKRAKEEQKQQEEREKVEKQLCQEVYEFGVEYECK